MSVEELKEQIKNIPLSRAVGHYIPVKKQGANHEAICPFHNDHNPSLKINDSMGIYKCFVCGASGDAIKFVSEHLHLNFIESLKELGESFGFSTDDLEKKKKINPEAELGLRVLKSTEQVYHQFALKSMPSPFQNFLHSRKISLETAKKYRLGMAPANNILVTYLQNLEKEHSQVIKVALKLGVIKQGRRGLYDTFQDRVIFPIWDQSGHPRGFSSRSLTEDRVPKYLNSQESFLFNKRNIIYGLHLAKQSIRERQSIILTEGYMDAISLYQNGFRNVVAIMGIALSDYACKMLSNQAKTIYLALDNDHAGYQAAQRINQTFLTLNVLPKIIQLNPSKDPDEFIQNHSETSFQERVTEAQTFIDFFIQEKITHTEKSSTEDKLQTLTEIFQSLSPLKTSLQATERAIRASQGLGLQTAPETVLENYKKLLTAQTTKTHLPTVKHKQKEKNLPTKGHKQEKEKEQKHKFTRCPTAQKILKALFTYPNILNNSKFTEVLDFVTNTEIESFIRSLWEIYQEVSEDDFLPIVSSKLSSESASESLKQFIYSILYDIAPREVSDSEAEKVFKDLKHALEIEKLKMQKQLLKRKRLGTTEKNDVFAIDLEIITLSKKINELNNQTRF